MIGESNKHKVSPSFRENLYKIKIVYIFLIKFSFSVVKHEVVGVVGEKVTKTTKYWISLIFLILKVAIPCNCTPTYSQAGDKPALILWYKDKAKMPIYRFVKQLLCESLSTIYTVKYLYLFSINNI